MTTPTNPFQESIQGVWKQACALEWSFPYLHIIVSAMALFLVLTVLVILFPTVGVFLQISASLSALTEEARSKLASAQSYEKIGYATWVGVLFAISLPFTLLSLPLYVIANLIKKLFERMESWN